MELAFCKGSSVSFLPSPLYHNACSDDEKAQKRYQHHLSERRQALMNVMNDIVFDNDGYCPVMDIEAVKRFQLFALNLAVDLTCSVCRHSCVHNH